MRKKMLLLWCKPMNIYTGEDLKWELWSATKLPPESPLGCHFKSLLPFGNRSLGELNVKQAVIILQ